MTAPARPTLVTADAVIFASPATLYAFLISVAAAAQTVKLHDCAAVGDAAAGNEKFRFDTTAIGTFDIGNAGAYFAVGIVAKVSGGTPVGTVVAG